MLEKFDLSGKVALVTGGGGGLGTAMSLALAEAGADIVVTDFRSEDGERTVKKLNDSGHKAVFFYADVTKSAEVNQMMGQAIAQWGKIDILVNCAGVVREEVAQREHKQLWDITDHDWHLGIDTNLTGAFFCSRAVSKHMVERQYGKIINIASGFGMRGLRRSFMYPPAKAGVILLTMSLSLTLAREGIRVNAVAPGLFRSSDEGYRVSLYDKRGQHIPIGRVGLPHEIAPLVVYLASEASDYATGELFAYDGAALAGGAAPVGFAPVIPI